MATALAPTTECRLLDALRPQEKAAWISALADMRHDVYHHPEFACIDAKVTGGEPFAFHFREYGRRILVPLVVRDLPEPFASHSRLRGYRDATSPYGYPSPIAEFSNDDTVADRASFIGRAMERLATELRSRGIVSAFLRFHPLLSDLELFDDFSATTEQGKSVEHGEAVYCDLTQTPEQMWQQTRRRDRSYINKLQREGYRLVIDSNWRKLDQFLEMYYATMRRVSANDFYFFPRSYFEDLRTSLRDHTHLAFIITPNNELACGAIVTSCGDILQYHLAGTNDGFRGGHPNKLLIHQLRLWGKARGLRAFNLGGGVGASSDSLLHFKSGFSKLRAPFGSYRLITNTAVYTRLLRQWESITQEQAGDMTRFFPAYRQPIGQLGHVHSTVRRGLRLVRADGTIHEPQRINSASRHSPSPKRRAA